MKKTLLAFVLFGMSSSLLQAKVTLPRLFTDNMVLQQHEQVKIWGTSTEKGKSLKLTTGWNQKAYTTKIDAQGNWSVTVQTPSYGGPYQINIQDNESFVLNNVLIGEVWFCSGQSNMEMPLAGWGNITNYQQEINAANFPNIRLFQVEKATASRPESMDAVKAVGWNEVNPTTIPEFSATAYFFAQTLFQKTGIPIGLIHSSWGGTIIEAWMSKDAIVPFKAYQDKLEKVWNNTSQATYEKELTTWLSQVEAADMGMNSANKWFSKQVDLQGWTPVQLPNHVEDIISSDFDGIVYFRKNIQIPQAWVGKELTLKLGEVDDEDITFVNGQEIGRGSGYNVPRTYVVPASVNKDKSLQITVRVFDSGGGGGIYGKTQSPVIIGPDAQQIDLSGEWQSRIAVRLADLPEKPISNNGPNRPTVLYNAMVNPFVDYKIKGAIWYQGESNTETKEAPYNQLLPALIQDWRQQWHNPQMPFIFVQLANYKAKQANYQPSSWARLREAQWQTLKIPNTGMAVIADIGDAMDIHPKNKQDVGRRLAYHALAKVYKQNVPYSGPVFQEWKSKNGQLEIELNPMGQKLKLVGNQVSAGSFLLAAADQKFYPAEFILQGNKIILKAKEVKNPVAFRYAWADNPDLVLYNDAGLPASPFRSDDWDN